MATDTPAYRSSYDPTTSRYGVNTLTPAGNLTMFFERRAIDLVTEDDESLLPSYLQKYIEYGVIARAYKANTDGRIQSLADYWTMRRNAGLVVIKRYMSKRLADREYRMETGRMNSESSYRHPRLPDEYPETYP